MKGEGDSMKKERKSKWKRFCRNAMVMIVWIVLECRADWYEWVLGFWESDDWSRGEVKRSSCGETVRKLVRGNRGVLLRFCASVYGRDYMVQLDDLDVRMVRWEILGGDGLIGGRWWVGRVVSHWCMCDVSVSPHSGEGISRGQVGQHTRRTRAFNRPKWRPLILPSSTRHHPNNLIIVVVLPRLQTR